MIFFWVDWSATSPNFRRKKKIDGVLARRQGMYRFIIKRGGGRSRSMLRSYYLYNSYEYRDYPDIFDRLWWSIDRYLMVYRQWLRHAYLISDMWWQKDSIQTWIKLRAWPHVPDPRQIGKNAANTHVCVCICCYRLSITLSVSVIDRSLWPNSWRTFQSWEGFKRFKK